MFVLSLPLDSTPLGFPRQAVCRLVGFVARAKSENRFELEPINRPTAAGRCEVPVLQQTGLLELQYRVLADAKDFSRPCRSDFVRRLSDLIMRLLSSVSLLADWSRRPIIRT